MLDADLIHFIHNIIVIIKVAVPVILVILGMLDFAKGVTSGKEDEIKKGQGIFVKRLIAGACVFFVVTIVQLVMSVVSSDDNSFWNCANQILNGVGGTTYIPNRPIKGNTNDGKNVNMNATSSSGKNQNNSNINKSIYSGICPKSLRELDDYDDNCNYIGGKRDSNISSTNTNNSNNSSNTDINANSNAITNSNVTSNVIKSEKVDVKKNNGVTYFNGILIVNKSYSLPSSYAPDSALGKYNCKECLTTETLSAFNEMKNAAARENLKLNIVSGYRSYKNQEDLYNNYVKRDGKAGADRYSARSGHSEHQTGFAFDVNNASDSFTNTKEGKWINNNCYKYGFIVRYPNGKEKYTGFKYESWHLRYVGKELAETLYNNGSWVSLEEYFDITSEYRK